MKAGFASVMNFFSVTEREMEIKLFLQNQVSIIIITVIT